MVGEILGAVTDIMGMLSSNNANDEYQKQLEQIRRNNKLSQSALQAKALLAENSTRGLPGYETMREDINNRIPTTLNEARDFLSGSGVVDYLSRARAATDQQLRTLDAQNQQARMNNLGMYANYLGGAMAGQENRQQAIDTGLSMNQANANVFNQAAQNQFMGSVANRFGQMGDQDWAKLIALLSKSTPSMPSGGQAGDLVEPTSNPYNLNYA